MPDHVHRQAARVALTDKDQALELLAHLVSQLDPKDVLALIPDSAHLLEAFAVREIGERREDGRPFGVSITAVVYPSPEAGKDAKVSWQAVQVPYFTSPVPGAYLAPTLYMPGTSGEVALT